MQWRKDTIPFLAALMFTLLFLYFPSRNNTGDAYGYAAEMWELIQFRKLSWSPHHLLYNPFGAYSWDFFGSLFCRRMAWMQAVNSLFAGAALFFLFKIISRFSDTKTGLSALLLCGSSFGLMRFATENETYIIPLALSMAGSYVLLINNNSKWRLTGGFILLSISVLFHQMHIWWLLAAVYAFRKHKFAVISGLLSCMLIVAAYIMAANASGKPWYLFPFSDAAAGTVQLLPGIDNVKFTTINSIRTWMQVHGNIHYFLHRNWFLLIMACSALAIIIFSMLPVKMLRAESVDSTTDEGIRFFRIALLLHFLWAFYSVGNAEFMVMIPFLLCMSFPLLVQKFRRRLSFVALGLLMWNLSVAVIPNHIYRTQLPELHWQKIHSHTSELDTTYFVARQKNLLENVDASWGGSPESNRYYYNLIMLTAPSDRGPHTASEPDIAKLIESGKRVITDCIDYPEPTSRASMLGGNKNREFFSRYELTAIDSFDGFYGLYRFYKVSLKK